jgi:hypothetical protein
MSIPAIRRHTMRWQTVRTDPTELRHAVAGNHQQSSPAFTSRNHVKS